MRETVAWTETYDNQRAEALRKSLFLIGSDRYLEVRHLESPDFTGLSFQSLVSCCSRSGMIYKD